MLYMKLFERSKEGAGETDRGVKSIKKEKRPMSCHLEILPVLQNFQLECCITVATTRFPCHLKILLECYKRPSIEVLY